MRTVCDVCESAPAEFFCAADEAALCQACDEKVHMCNKLASRHVRVGLSDPSEVPRCDICENAPAFFYCGVDASSLCLQCDMMVHVGGKRTHGRYLLLRQRVEFPGHKQVHSEDADMQPIEPGESGRDQNHVPKSVIKGRMQNHKNSVAVPLDANTDDHGKIDLNIRPLRTHEQASNVQTQGMDLVGGPNHDSVGVVPTRPFKCDIEK